MKKLILTICLSLFAIPAFAATKVKIPTLKVCVNGAGVVTVKQKCAKTEATADYSLLKGNQGNPGQNGSNGQNGTNGTVDISRCFKRESSASGTGIISAESACLVSEYVVASSCQTSDLNSYIVSHDLLNGSNSMLGDQIYGLVKCYSGNFTNNFYTLTTQALCCQP